MCSKTLTCIAPWWSVASSLTQPRCLRQMLPIELGKLLADWISGSPKEVSRERSDPERVYKIDQWRIRPPGCGVGFTRSPMREKSADCRKPPIAWLDDQDLLSAHL